MGDEVKIDKALFQERLGQLVSAWKADKRAGDTLFGGVGSIVVLLGKADDTAYQKNNALHFWLLGYEFPATLMIFTPDTLYVVTTSKKAKHLEPLTGGKIPIVIHIRGKEADANQKIWDKCSEAIKSAGKKVGLLTKLESTGPFADEWKEAYKKIGDVEEVDISNALSSVLAVKDENELRAIRSASKACTTLMTEYFVEEMSGILDEEKKVSHDKLTKEIDKKIDDTRFFANAKSKLPSDFSPENLDWVYGPVIQSGGVYDLKLSATSTNTNLHAGVIIAGLGLRYKSYCSILARTYLVDPNKSQEATYKLLLRVHETVVKEAQDGAVAKDVYNKAIGVVRAAKPELEKHFLKNVGGGIGIETRDSTLLLNGKNTRVLKDGMTFCVMTGFTDVPNTDSATGKSGKTYSLFLADTIRIRKEGGTVVFTRDAASDLDSTTFYFKDEEEDAKQDTPKKNKKDSRIGAVAAANITKSRLRAERATQIDEGAELKRRQHQKELAQKKQQEGLKTYKEGTGSLNGVTQKKFKRFESYKRDNQLSSSKVKDLAIFVDNVASSVILPIMGRPVPFHINTIKNASASEEGDYAYLRINFLSPGQGVGRKDDQPFEDPNAHFVRSLTFRSLDRSRMSAIADQINDLRKNITKKEQEKKEFEDVVQQDKLVEIRNRKPARLDTVYVRPALEGKRVAGEIEIHQNGVMYRDSKGAKIEVLFSNTKHLFFQPCQGELIVIIHFHLKNPIVIGKRKTKDVQFYREATDMQFDETGNRKRRHRMGDEEEFEMEQEERRRRAALDKEFKAFAERIQSAAEGEFGVDVPFRDLGFHGVPFRSNVLMQPTTDCLVQLTEPPFTVITLDEIEVAHLERVQFGLKNFDMVFVYKDYSRPVTHVNTIPVESLESVKDWLDSCNIPYSEGPLNLNWGTIMKTVTADPHQFYVDGGWSFLQADSDDEHGSDEEEAESAFEISDSDLAQSDESSEDESEFDDDASADASEEEDSDDEEGEDWDELEKKAAKKDREGGLNDEEDKGRKRKR